jgi:tRNA-modifying protein YgfZ
MIQALRDVQADDRATFVEGVPVSFGHDTAALQAAQAGVALCDRTHWGRLQVSDADRLRFLHNQSTNDFQSLKPGQGCDTVFVTSTARTIDLATAYVTEDTVLLLLSPNRRQQLMEWLDRYIFPLDAVQLQDVTSQSATFSLIGPGSDHLLEQLGMGIMVGQAYANHQVLPVPPVSSYEEENRGSIRVAVGSGLSIPGYTLIVPAEDAATVWTKLVAWGAIPMGDRIWEQLRIIQGRPVPDRELTDDYNPLEAGLWQTISFSKGCYIGQETIARLNTYKGVKQQLWGVKLRAPVAPETLITIGEEKVGKLTSYTETEQGLFGLAYIRTKAGGAGLKVQVGDVEGEIVDVPFLTRESQ